MADTRYCSRCNTHQAAGRGGRRVHIDMACGRQVRDTVVDEDDQENGTALHVAGCLCAGFGHGLIFFVAELGVVEPEGFP